MSDESQAPDVDTPDPAAALEQQPNESTVDWEKRYQDAQAWGTQRAQEASEYRKIVDGLKSGDPDVFRELGLEFEDPEDTTPDDGDDPYAGRISKLEQQLEEQRSAVQQQQQLQQIESHVERELDKLGELDEEDREILVNLAVTLPPLENGMPNVKAAHDRLQARDTQAQKRWAQSKRAPRVSPAGQAGTQQPDLDDPQARVAWMVEQAQNRAS